jgi:predicted GNAT family acetyltransferase
MMDSSRGVTPSDETTHHPVTVRFQLTRDVDEFAAHAEAFLAGQVERNVMATILLRARGGQFAPPDRLFAVGLDGGRVAAAAMRIPPWPLLTTTLDVSAADALLAAWLPEDPDVDAVNAERDTARAIAAAWTRQTGGQATCRMREAMHLCGEVIDPPRPAAGGLRTADAADRELLIAWERAFVDEAGVIGGDPVAMVDARLARGGQHVWVDGEAVATLGLSPAIAGVVRIGPVYTPPPRRRHGYASSAVAAAVRLANACGAERCLILTDLANPTSNKIYAAVGFERRGDWEELALTPGTTTDAAR